MTGPLGPILQAHAFLTRLPMPARATASADISRAVVFFPLVGLTVGIIAAAVRWAADPLGPWFACVAACVAAPLVTGAFHEDGLADTFDALGPFDRSRRLEVMRDSRVGTFGALALVASFAARVALLAPLGVRPACALLVAGHVLGRWSTLPLARWCTPARAEGLGAGAGRIGTPTLFGGTLLAAAVAVPALWYVSGTAVVTGIATTLVVVAFTGAWWTRAFGGVTGDTFGATNQLCEIAAIAAGVGAR